MPDDSLSSLAGPVIPLANSIFTHARRLNAERQAGQVFFETGRRELVDEEFGKTLTRLLGETIDDNWWVSIVTLAEHPIITPEFLRAPALKGWLANPEVQANIKKLARARVLGVDENDNPVREKLRQIYAEVTGEDEQLADEPIDVVVAILTAGFFASIESRQRPLVGIMQAQMRENRAGFQQVSESINTLITQRMEDDHADLVVVKAHTNEASKFLQAILKKRSLRPSRTREEIVALAQRVVEGDLCYAKPSERAKVLYWAARLHSMQIEDHPIGRRHLDQLRNLDSSFDTRVVDALMLEAEGEVDGALRILRDMNDPDGHTTLFIILYRKRGNNHAIAWFEEQADRHVAKFLTGIGWTNLAICLAEIGRWEDAAAILKTAQVYIQEWPDLAFVEGVINAAMLLPGELRQQALRMELFHPMIQTVQGPKVDELRTHANTCFNLAAKLMDEIGEEERAQAAQDWRLWLRLTDPKPEVSDVARKEVRENMAEGRRAVDLLPFTRAFSIDFDEGPLKLYLSQRARLGGLKGRELMAEVLLAEKTMSPRDLAEFLEREEQRLSQAVSKAMLVGRRIEALVADGQTARAKHLLNERQEDLSGHDLERLKIMIISAEGSDPRIRLEELYQETGSLIDLQNLVRHLRQVGDWTVLRPLILELYSRERTTDNARRVVQCLQQDPTPTYASIVAFFQDNQDVDNGADDLSSAKAWAYFHIGDLKGAQRINDRLLQDRSTSVDLHLDINLAVQSGDWDRFPAIVDREWDKRDEYDADILLRLATLAAEAGTTERAFDLAQLATRKAPHDTKVLLGAYVLAVQLGREKDSDPAWISQAAELSQEDGPIWKMDMRTVIEQMVPAHRERTREVERNLQKGGLPLHLATSFLNVPLSRLLIDTPHRNAKQQDGRLRAIVPIISGARQALDIRSDWAMGLDATSLMVLHYLGLLDSALNAFRQIVLAPETMVILINERRRVRFHQPSRIKDAEEVRELIDNGRLKSADCTHEPPRWLIEEVGRDLAEMLELARVNKGRVVRPRPIFKLSTFLEKEAELKEYNDLILSTPTFARLLHEKGFLDEEMYNRSHLYLVARDNIPEVPKLSKEVAEPPEEMESPLDLTLLNHPLYLDDLAVTYLQQAELLQRLIHCNLNLWIHPSMRVDQDALIAVNRHGEQLSVMLNEIRILLRNVLDSGRAILLPQHDLNIEETGTVSGFLANIGTCDAVCIDDRYMNRHSKVTDQNGRSVPIVCTLDVLRYLQERGVMSTQENWGFLHKLREGGFALIPIEIEELKHLLYSAQLDSEPQLVESAELRVIRQTLMRIRSLDMVGPLDVHFLSSLRLVSFLTIHGLWEDNELPVDRAISLTDWVWKNFTPSPLEWQRSGLDQSDNSVVRNAFVQHLVLLLSPMLHVPGKRYKSYLEWLERVVIEPLLPSDADLMNNLAIRLRSEIKQLVEKLEEDEQNASR